MIFSLTSGAISKKILQVELSAGDQQVLVNFYKFYNLPDQNIHTIQEVLNRSHALIGRTDWLDAKGLAYLS